MKKLFAKDRIGPGRRNMSRNAVSEQLLPVDNLPLPQPPWGQEVVGSQSVVAEIAAGPSLTFATPSFYNTAGSEPKHPGGVTISGQALAISKVANASVLPWDVALGANGKLLKLFFDGRRLREALVTIPGSELYSYRGTLPPRIVRGIGRPVLVADTSWPEVYGHVLLEVVPQLMLADSVPPESLILTSVPLDRTLLVICKQLGIAAEKLVHFDRPLLCAEAYWGDLPLRLGDNPHPLALAAFDRLKMLGRTSAAGTPERVFVSRTGARGRRLAQEREVEDLFSRRGFVVLHPEQMLFEDQVRVFAGAKLIAGLGGSGMHNTVFAAPDASVLVLQTGDLGIGVDLALTPTDRSLGYVFGTSSPGNTPYSAPWSIDIAAVDAGIRLHFGLR